MQIGISGGEVATLLELPRLEGARLAGMILDALVRDGRTDWKDYLDDFTQADYTPRRTRRALPVARRKS